MTVIQGNRQKGPAKIQGVTQARSRESALQTSDTLVRGPGSTQPFSQPPTSIPDPQRGTSPVTHQATPVPWATSRVSPRTGVPDLKISRDSVKVQWFLNALIKNFIES